MYALTLNNKVVTVKKERQCFSCLRRFPVGTRMNYWAGKIEGNFNAVYSCMTCVEIMNMKQDPDDSCIPEGFTREMLENGETPEQMLERFKAEIGNPAVSINVTVIN